MILKLLIDVVWKMFAEAACIEGTIICQFCTLMYIVFWRFDFNWCILMYLQFKQDRK